MFPLDRAHIPSAVPADMIAIIAAREAFNRRLGAAPLRAVHASGDFVGFDGLDGIGKKLKKAVKKVAKPVQRVITAPVKAIQRVAPAPIAKPMAKAIRLVKKTGTTGRQLVKNPLVQKLGAAVMPIAALPALADKGFRRNTLPVYAAYGVVGAAALTGGAAAGAMAAGTAAAEQGSAWYAADQAAAAQESAQAQWDGWTEDDVPMMPGDEPPAPAPVEEPVVDASTASPLKPLALVSAALTALSFLK